MAPKKKSNNRRLSFKIPGQSSASDPNPTATSPSASSPTGDATTTFPFPSPSSPCTPPSTIPLLSFTPPQPISLLPSSALQITTTQPLPSAPPSPIQETNQERTSCTSDGAATTDLAGPSTAHCSSAASMETQAFLYTVDQLISLFTSGVSSAKEAMQIGMGANSALLQTMLLSVTWHTEYMESVLECLLALLEKMKGEEELKAALEGLAKVGVTEMLLAEITERLESSGCWGGSKGQGGGPDSDTSDGDGEVCEVSI